MSGPDILLDDASRPAGSRGASGSSLGAIDIDTPDPLYFQQASMLMLLFRFKRSRKVVASRLMASRDFRAELEAYLPILDRYYGSYVVGGVEVVSYQRGGFYYDPWPGGLELVRAHQALRGLEDVEEVLDDGLDDGLDEDFDEEGARDR